MSAAIRTGGFCHDCSRTGVSQHSRSSRKFRLSKESNDERKEGGRREEKVEEEEEGGRKEERECNLGLLVHFPAVQT